MRHNYKYLVPKVIIILQMILTSCSVNSFNKVIDQLCTGETTIIKIGTFPPLSENAEVKIINQKEYTEDYKIIGKFEKLAPVNLGISFVKNVELIIEESKKEARRLGGDAIFPYFIDHYKDTISFNVPTKNNCAYYRIDIMLSNKKYKK